MEQLTEFVSKSFTSDRLPLMSTHQSIGPASRPLSPIVSSLIPTSMAFGSGLSFFRPPPHHAIPFSTLHSMVDRLNGSHLSHLAALPFLPPAFHTTPPVDLSLLSNSRRDDKSPSLSPGRVEVCTPASVTDVDSRPSIEAAGVDPDSEEDSTRPAGETRGTIT